MSLTNGELAALETTARIASCLSVVGTIFICVTFLTSSRFQRPINRLIFFASWGNTICNIATLMSRSPIAYGSNSHLCQFQAFLIQMFVPADAFWNLAMAFNVYLTLFRKYNSTYLKSLEWRYVGLCYGIPFVIAFVLLFPSPAGRGKIYGDAVLWCWIDADWEFLRVGLCYGPAWCCILLSMTIYVLAGREIFIKRHQLRAFRHHGIGDAAIGGAGAGAVDGNGKGAPGLSDPGSIPSDDSTTIIGDADATSRIVNYKTTNVEITSTILPLENVANVLLSGTEVMGNHNPRGAVGAGIRTESTMSGKVYEQYSVNIGAQPMGSPRPDFTRVGSGQVGGTDEQARARSHRATMEANRAAWGYTKVAVLFFISLLVTWVPSSVNRVYALTHPGAPIPVPIAFAASIVLSLMGFWNSVIYIVTSRAACKELFYSIMLYFRRRKHRGSGGSARIGSELGYNDNSGMIAGMGSPLGHRRPSLIKSKLSWGDDWERLQGEGDGGGIRRSEISGGGGPDLEMGKEEIVNEA